MQKSADFRIFAALQRRRTWVKITTDNCRPKHLPSLNFRLVAESGGTVPNPVSSGGGDSGVNFAEGVPG